MEKIAVLLTCFNRKDKTLNCLEAFYSALEVFQQRKELKAQIYLTDDGSTDGTAEAVLKKYPNTKVIQGTGDLFWANGMRSSWTTALKGNYDAYLLLNDDTTVYKDVLFELFKTHTYSLNTYKEAGIYVGATEDQRTKELTYSGAVVTNFFTASIKVIVPDGVKYQRCDFGNANIMLVPKEVVEKIGILSAGYAHGKADYDYTMMARKAKVPALIGPKISGHCVYDHDHYYVNWENKSLSERWKVLYSPTGIDFKSQLKFNRKFFPFRFPLVLLSGYFKLFFPKIYLRRFNIKHKE
jgi:GT2 family glycosyltransferase